MGQSNRSETRSLRGRRNPLRVAAWALVTLLAARATVADGPVQPAPAPAPTDPTPRDLNPTETTAREAAARQATPGDATVRVQAIRARFHDLADPNPITREEARGWLLTLEPTDLSLLQAVVKQSRPIRRSQIAALREVVMHVYLRSDIYPRDPAGRGFLGVKFSPSFPGADASEPEAGGVEIRERMLGFCAYRSLEDGDLLRAVVGNPPAEVHTPKDVIAAVSGFRAGDTLVLEVLRDGRLLRIPIVLDPRPAVMDNEAATPDFLGRRQTEADAYWEEHFDALVNDKVS